MTNAALHLAQLIETWDVEGGHRPAAVRGLNPDDVDCWREQTRIANLVAAIDETLQGMKAIGDNVAVFEEYLPRWYGAVYWIEHSWTSPTNSTQRATEPYVVQMLTALGHLIDATEPLDLTEEDRRSLADVLAEAEALLQDEASSIPKDVRVYLWGLINRAQTIYSAYEKFGTEAVRQVSLELSGALHAQGERAAHEGDAPQAGRWKALAVQLMLGFAGGASSGAVGAITDIAARAITK